MPKYAKCSKCSGCIVQNTERPSEIQPIRACRICLVSGTKYYNINQSTLDIFYELMTGVSRGEDLPVRTYINSLPERGSLNNIPVAIEHLLPMVLCWECAFRLVSFWKLKSKAKKSIRLLQDIIQRERTLNNASIASIDRYAHNLTSSLSFKTFNVNHSDLHLHDTTVIEPSMFPEENDQNFTLDLEVKIEDQENPKNELENDFEADDINFDKNSNPPIHSTSSSDIVLAKHKIKEKNNKKNIKSKCKKKDKLTVLKVDRRRKPAKDVLNEDIFRITDLTYEEQLLEVKKRQESCNYKRAEFVCEKCYKGFLDEEAFKCHMLRHTYQSGTFECDICKVRFQTQHALRNHISSHVQKFSCRRCPYVTTRRHAAKLHEEYHNGTKYQCPHCQEEFAKFSTYMSHVRLKHPSDFVCERCGCSFVSVKGLGLHKKLKHRVDGLLPIPSDGPHCVQCGVRFATEEALDKHMKLSARHKDTIESKDTSRITKEQNSTEQHSTRKKNAQKRPNKNNCKPEGPIPCEQCDVQLPDSVSYYRHFRRMHPDKNRTKYPSMKTKCMCEVCGKMFQSLALLQDHSFTHTDLKQFKCGQCGKTFQRKYRLIAHRKLHASQRTSHACSVCGKRFTTASNMHRHMVSHTGLKPFKCEMCGKCFKHASEKRVHVTYVHLNKPWPKRRRGKRPVNAQAQVQTPPVAPSSEDLVQPLWPSCSDTKMADVLNEKPVYYNLKL